MIQDPILVVDDEADIREALKESLELDGYRVDTAASAAEALALLEKRFYPVVLTDLNMPGGLTGFDLIAEVKARDSRTLCVVLTGYASIDTAVSAVKHGAYDFLQKPFKIHEVEAVMNRALEHASLVGQLQTYQQDLEARVAARTVEMRAFQRDVETLDELLLAVQAEPEEGLVALPFLQYLRTRFGVDGCAFYTRQASGWRLASQEGARPPACPGSLPAAPAEVDEWTTEGWYAEGYLVPLRAMGELLGMVLLGFETRAAFSPDDTLLQVWRRHLEAALSGLRRTHLVVEMEVARALRVKEH